MISKNNILYLLWIGLLFRCLPFNAQQLKVTSSLDTNVIKIGAQTIWRIEATAPIKSKILFPQFKDSVSDHIECLGVLSTDTVSKTDNNITVRRKYILTSFDSGYFPIPPASVYLDGDSSVSAVTEADLLTVRTIPVDTTKAIKAIKGPQDVPWKFTENFKLIAFIVGALVLTILLLIYLRKRRKKAPIAVEPKEVKIPAHEIALDRLNKLKEQKLWQQGSYKLYHVQLSEIVRTYIEDRFHFAAKEMTTGEISAVFYNSHHSQTAYSEIIRILQLSDMVKFAKAQPLPHENEAAISVAYEFVKSTIIPLSQLNDQKL